MALTFYATNNFTGDGTTTQWNINFADGYISPDDVKSRYVDSSGSFVDITVTSVNGNVITISPAQPAGRVFQIYRDTQKSSPLVDFADGAILNETNLDTLATQAIMVAAEASDLSNSLSVVAYDALVNSSAAASDAAAAAAAASSAQASANSAQTAAADAQTSAGSAQNAASAAQASASTAVNTANAASATAGTALSTANSATTAANTATSTANTALSTANSANTAAGNAVTTANTAASNASTALSTANAANTAAGNAVTTANAASATANGIAGTANTALTNANSAVTTANAANTAAGNAVTTANAAAATANGLASSIADANTTAQDALDVANGISGTANNALTAATAAQSDAAAAVSTANSAASDASTAITAAADAQADATAAGTAAGNAQTTANTAVTNAAAAQTGVNTLDSRPVSLWNKLALSTTSNGLAGLLTATSLLVRNAAGAQKLLTGLNISFTKSNVIGAGNLDSGGTWVASTWYVIYVINGTSGTNIIFSTNGTAPTLPSGYTYYRKVGWFRNTGANSWLPFTQWDNHVTYTTAADNGYLLYNASPVGTTVPLDVAGVCPNETAGMERDFQVHAGASGGAQPTRALWCVSNGGAAGTIIVCTMCSGNSSVSAINNGTDRNRANTTQYVLQGAMPTGISAVVYLTGFTYGQSFGF